MTGEFGTIVIWAFILTWWFVGVSFWAKHIPNLRKVEQPTKQELLIFSALLIVCGPPLMLFAAFELWLKNID